MTKEIFDQFEYSDRKIFMSKKGRANNAGDAPCQWKLCITATDEHYLVELLLNLSERDDCYFVKFSPSGSPKCGDGMFLGRVFLTSEEETGKLWSKLRTDKKLMCNIQADNVLEKYRE